MLSLEQLLEWLEAARLKQSRLALVLLRERADGRDGIPLALVRSVLVEEPDQLRAHVGFEQGCPVSGRRRTLCHRPERRGGVLLSAHGGRAEYLHERDEPPRIRDQRLVRVVRACELREYRRRRFACLSHTGLGARLEQQRDERRHAARRHDGRLAVGRVGQLPKRRGRVAPSLGAAALEEQHEFDDATSAHNLRPVVSG